MRRCAGWLCTIVETPLGSFSLTSCCKQVEQVVPAMPPNPPWLSRPLQGMDPLELLWYGFILTAFLRATLVVGKCSAATAWPSSPGRPWSASPLPSCNSSGSPLAWSTLQGEVSVSVQLLRADTRSQVIDGHTRKGFVSRSARGTAAGRFLVRLSRNWKLTDLNTSP